jgi:hypothetical protein
MRHLQPPAQRSPAAARLVSPRLLRWWVKRKPAVLENARGRSIFLQDNHRAVTHLSEQRLKGSPCAFRETRVPRKFFEQERFDAPHKCSVRLPNPHIRVHQHFAPGFDFLGVIGQASPLA